VNKLNNEDSSNVQLIQSIYFYSYLKKLRFDIDKNILTVLESRTSI